MSFTVINPASGQVVMEIPAWDDAQIEQTLAQTAAVTPGWAATPLAQRCTMMRRAAQVLRDNVDRFGGLITQEMGKLLKDAKAEVEKCATVCDYYAEHGPDFLQDEVIASDAGKKKRHSD